MKEPSKPKLKNKDVDEKADEVLAGDEEVESPIVYRDSALEDLTTTSAITADETLVSSTENTRLRRNERKQTVSAEVSSPNEDRRSSGLRPTPGNSQQSSKDNEGVKNYHAAEVIDTEEYLIITLSASRRRELPETKKSQQLLMPENNPLSSNVASQLYKEVIQSTESEIAKISSKYSEVSSKSSDSTSNTSVESYKTASECREVYKAKTPFVLYDASEATTKHPDAEFYAEILNHTTPTKWNNPVLYNRYPIYFNPSRHFPYVHRPSKPIHKRYTVKIPKKFATFLLRVLKSKDVHRERENMPKKERLPAKTPEPHDSTTEELGSPRATSSRAARIPTLADIEKHLVENSSEAIDATKPFNPLSTSTRSAADFIDPISSNSTTETLEKPSTMKHRHRYPTSSSEADPFSTGTQKHIDPSNTKISDQTHSTRITKAQPIDPLSMNPIKFREKLRKLSNSKSTVESSGVKKKSLGSKHKTRATPKTRALPTKNETSKIGSISNVELSNNEETLVWTTPESGPIPKGGCLLLEKSISKESQLLKKMSKDKIPKSGGIPKDGSVSKRDALPKNEGKATEKILNLGSVPKIEAVQTEETIPKGVSALKGDAPSISAIPIEGKAPRYGAVHKRSSTSKSDIQSETESSKSETSTTRTVTVLPEDGSKSKTFSKTQSGPHLRKGQYRDIPVIAYVRRFKRHPPKTNLDYYLPKEDDSWIRGYWRKFKYFKRIESGRQKSLLEKIVRSLNQIDLSLQSAYNYSNSIDKLRKVTCDIDEFLRYRNNKMKWLISRLMHKTEIIMDALETIRCDVVLYTLETSASNDITSKRLYKLLKYLCGKQERKRKSEGKLTPVEEEENLNAKS